MIKSHNERNIQDKFTWVMILEDEGAYGGDSRQQVANMEAEPGS